MVTEQLTIEQRMMRITKPVLNIGLHISPNFNGRVMVYFENGHAICDRPLLDEEHVNTLDGFLELARMAGYKVEE